MRTSLRIASLTTLRKLGSNPIDVSPPGHRCKRYNQMAIMSRYSRFGHHPVTGAKLDKIRPNFAKFNSQPVCPTLSENLQFPEIRFISPIFPSLHEQSDLYSGSEEVRSSVLIGSTKFPDIFCIFLNGLRGNSLIQSGPVPFCEEVFGSNRATNNSLRTLRADLQFPPAEYSILLWKPVELPQLKFRTIVGPQPVFPSYICPIVAKQPVIQSAHS